MVTNQVMAETQTADTGTGDTSPAPDGPEPADRPMRADARRNRERILEAARAVFAEQGTAASMEAIARTAGVGVGTLYRHFPTRVDVVEALYDNDVHVLADAAQRAVAELEPWAAVEAFFVAFMDYTLTKQTLMTELHQAFEKNPDMRSRARELIDASFDIVVENGKRAGVVRPDIAGTDVTQLTGPVCTNATVTPEQRRRLMGMILDGLRTPAQPSILG